MLRNYLQRNHSVNFKSQWGSDSPFAYEVVLYMYISLIRILNNSHACWRVVGIEVYIHLEVVTFLMRFGIFV